MGAARGRPEGGASCLGVGSPGLGAPPPPTARPFGRAAGACYPLVVGAGGAGVLTRHQPHSRRSCVLALRTVGAARGRPGGASLAWVWGVRGLALSHPRPVVLSGVRAGPTIHWLWVQGVPACGPVTNLTARALASWLCALWWPQEGAREGRLLPSCGASGVWRSPTPVHSSLGACGRGALPTGCGCGGCGRGDPSPTLPRTLLRAGFARCGGGITMPGGGVSCLGVGSPGLGALPPPTTRPFGRAAGAHYPLALGAGAAGVATRHPPHSARSRPLALRAAGAARGRQGWAPLAWVSGVRGRVLSHPRPVVLSGVRPGPTTQWLWVRGVRAWGPVTNPTARALASWLCALWGRHEVARGGRLLPGCRASGVRRSPTPDHSSFRACGRGPLPTGCGCGGCRHGDPSATPQRALLRAGVARCGGGTRYLGGAPLAWVWGVAGLALSHPRPLVLSGVRPGPTTNWLWVRGVQAWRPVTNPTARALASWLCALWWQHENARGGRLLPWCGASGVGRSLTPDLLSFRACGRGPIPTGCGCGGCGREDPSPTPQRALLRAGFARCGGGMRMPGGGASCLGVGRLGSGALSPPTTRPVGHAAGAHYPLAGGAGGAGVGTRRQPHRARSCELALRAVGVA